MGQKRAAKVAKRSKKTLAKKKSKAGKDLLQVGDNDPFFVTEDGSGKLILNFL